MAILAVRQPQTPEARREQAQQVQQEQVAQVVIELKNMNRNLEGIGKLLMEIRDEMKEKEEALDL
ncbi:MAG TPA: hypothetical protein VEZ44_10070 [bacterium]|nr:hypothetical protein [bacterium]